MKNLLSGFLSVSLSISMAGCGMFFGADHPPLDVVPSVDVAKYLGSWYEIASVPVSQQEGCYCTTAEYSMLDENTIRVVNSCRKGSPVGDMDRAEGKAFIVPGSNNAKLKVQFFWPFRGDYWIIDLAEDYSYASVGTPDREHFWILSRTPTMDSQLLDTLLTRVKQKGFDISQVQWTVQECP